MQSFRGILTVYQEWYPGTYSHFSPAPDSPRPVQPSQSPTSSSSHFSPQAVTVQHECSPVKMVSRQPTTLTIKQGSEEKDAAKNAVNCIILFNITVGGVCTS